MTKINHVYGLTGGIASGKSTVRKIFETLGVLTLDADVVARQLRTNDQDVRAQILHHFQTLEPSQLSQRIFQNVNDKKTLESILHPKIQEYAQNYFNQNLPLSRFSYGIYEASLLVETQSTQSFAGMIVVDCSEELQIKRLMSQRHLTESAARQLLSQQTTREQRLKYADKIITNNGDLQDLEQQTFRLHQALSK
jgi:dephospho-CoA kinase